MRKQVVAVISLHVAVTHYSVAEKLSGKEPPRCGWSPSTDTPKCNALSISEGARPAEQICGGMQETNYARRAALQVRLMRLKFAERQAQLQLLVEREQGELMQMNDRAYRSVARQCVRQRLEKMRAVRDSLQCGLPMQHPSGPGCCACILCCFRHIEAVASCLDPEMVHLGMASFEAPSP